MERNGPFGLERWGIPQRILPPATVSARIPMERALGRAVIFTPKTRLKSGDSTPDGQDIALEGCRKLGGWHGRAAAYRAVNHPGAETGSPGPSQLLRAGFKTRTGSEGRVPRAPHSRSIRQVRGSMGLGFSHWLHHPILHEPRELDGPADHPHRARRSGERGSADRRRTKRVLPGQSELLMPMRSPIQPNERP